MISAISPRGQLRFMVVKGGVGAALFIRFLKRLIQGAKRPIFLIVDGHPVHRAKAVTHYVSTVAQRLRARPQFLSNARDALRRVMCTNLRAA